MKTKEVKKTPLLDDFSRDLTKLASKNILDKVIGRDDEIRRTIQVLQRRTKNNDLLPASRTLTPYFPVVDTLHVHERDTAFLPNPSFSSQSINQQQKMSALSPLFFWRIEWIY
jgi:hypothetical protein